MSQIDQTRRNFIKQSLLTLSVLSTSAFFSATANQHAIRTGIQLYTLRQMMALSPIATLKLVAAIGYQEVEFAGYFDVPAASLAKILENEKLSAPAAHVMLDDFMRAPQKTIDDAQTLQHQYLVIPYLNESQRGKDISAYMRVAEQLNKLGEICAKANIKLAYHNHDFEFEQLDGNIPYDILLQQTQADLVCMEMDLYWMHKAKRDPLGYFARYPGRFPLWHIKDMAQDGSFADVGQGNIDFAKIFNHAKQAGLTNAFVERDRSADPLQSAQASYVGLSKLLRK